MNRTQTNLAVLAVAASAAACGIDFDPPSYLQALRVLAVEADKLEAGPGDSVTLRPRLFTPPGVTVTAVRWSFCPASVGAIAGFRCIEPACETTLSTGEGFSTTANPLALAQQCFLTLAGRFDGGVALPGAAGVLPEMVDTIFRLVVTDSTGATEEALNRFPLYPFGPPPARNRAPIITGLTLDGVAPDAQGALPAVSAALPLRKVTLEVTVDPASLDVFTDESGRTRTEDPIVSFFATAGRFEQDRASGVRGNVKWKADKLLEGDTEAQVWVVARDLRGGQTLAGPWRIPITR